jgi:hypothetical protein
MHRAQWVQVLHAGRALKNGQARADLDHHEVQRLGHVCVRQLARQQALHDLQARFSRYLLWACHTGADPGIHACAHVALPGQPGL